MTLCVYILIALMSLNIVKPVNGANTTASATSPTTTTQPPTTKTLYPPLRYWDYDVHCKFQPNGYPCDSSRGNTRWYFDTLMGDCKTYTNYKCKTSNRNDFKSYEECRLQCRDHGAREIPGDLPENAACIMQPDFGDCQDYNSMFYYDITNRRCTGFAFSGCGGNQNRFKDSKTCQTVCVPAAEVIEISSRVRNRG